MVFNLGVGGVVGVLFGFLSRVVGKWGDGIDFLGMDLGVYLEFSSFGSVSFVGGVSVGSWFKWGSLFGMIYMVSKVGSFSLGFNGGIFFVMFVDLGMSLNVMVIVLLVLLSGIFVYVFVIFDGFMLCLYVNGCLVGNASVSGIMMMMNFIVVGQ